MNPNLAKFVKTWEQLTPEEKDRFYCKFTEHDRLEGDAGINHLTDGELRYIIGHGGIRLMIQKFKKIGDEIGRMKRRMDSLESVYRGDLVTPTDPSG